MSAGAAAETFVDTFGRADGERAGLLVMEGTQPDEVRAAFAQTHIITDDFFYLRRRIDAFYGLSWNQFLILISLSLERLLLRNFRNS